jgi:hypothetical protein
MFQTEFVEKIKTYVLRGRVNNYSRCMFRILKKQGQRSYNYIILQHSHLALHCTLSITAQSALWPQNKKFWAERQATHAPFHPVAGLW